MIQTNFLSILWDFANVLIQVVEWIQHYLFLEIDIGGLKIVPIEWLLYAAPPLLALGLIVTIFTNGSNPASKK